MEYLIGLLGGVVLVTLVIACFAAVKVYNLLEREHADQVAIRDLQENVQMLDNVLERHFESDPNVERKEEEFE